MISTKLWKSNYSQYQEDLFDKISKLKEGVFTPLNYKKIAELLNNEGYKTPRGSIFRNNHVFSIYKKGMIRKERLERKDVVEVQNTLVQICYPTIKPY